MNCLDNVIKLSRTTCTCFDESKPVGFDEGKADVYLDELEGLTLDLLNQSSNCESGNVWELMIRSRENATKQFKADLLGCIGTNYTSRRTNYSGLIGTPAFNATLNIIENMAGLAVRTNHIVGGYMTVKRLGLIFNITAPITISVYSNEDLSTPIATYNVTSAANTLQYVNLSTPLVLPLWSNSSSTQLIYYFVYDLVGTYLPKNNKADCGCGGNKQAVAYKNWVMVNGIKGSTPNPLNLFYTTTEFNGLVLDADFKCDSTRLICSDEYPLDFEGDGRAMQIAYAIRFKAGEMLIESILSSPNINRYTMMDREALYGKRNRYRKLYEDWITYLCENTEVINNDCLMCRPNPNYIKGAIFS